MQADFTQSAFQKQNEFSPASSDRMAPGPSYAFQEYRAGLLALFGRVLQLEMIFKPRNISKDMIHLHTSTVSKPSTPYITTHRPYSSRCSAFDADLVVTSTYFLNSKS
mmetsp:Transcript_29098/g.47274  ORF Transcript_29098/g.47274 Transcript_29098/m.47274 type:complete len:108 (-) Transcript_29098:262-585(-)